MSYRMPLYLLLFAALSVNFTACFHASDGPDDIHDEGFSVEITKENVVGGSTNTTTATSSIEFDHHAKTLSGDITLNGDTADSVSIKTGYAGENDSSATHIVDLTTGTVAGSWVIPTNTVLTDAQNEMAERGQLYLSVMVGTNEILRGQLLTDDVSVTKLSLTAPSGVTTSGTGEIFLTKIDTTDSQSVVAFVHVDGITPTSVHIHDSSITDASANVVYTFEKVTADDSSVWKITGQPTAMTDAQEHTFADGKYYVNVHTAETPAGELQATFPSTGTHGH